MAKFVFNLLLLTSRIDQSKVFLQYDIYFDVFFNCVRSKRNKVANRYLKKFRQTYFGALSYFYQNIDVRRDRISLSQTFPL